MDKVSIVKDAIDYIQELQKEVKRMTEEVAELESAKEEKSSVSEITLDDHQVLGSKRRKMTSEGSFLATSSLGKPCIQVTEVKTLYCQGSHNFKTRLWPTQKGSDLDCRHQWPLVQCDP